MDGWESSTEARGGMDGWESDNAKAELATAQPATKATRLIFMVISPDILLISANSDRRSRRPTEVRATPEQEFPHADATLYA